jgi:hypothetical protein
MKTEMSRREFLASFFPVTAHVRTLGGYRQLAWRACKWALLAACVWFGWQILSGVPLDGWRALGWMALKFVIPAGVLIYGISRIQRWIDQSESVILQNVARGISRVAVLLVAVSAGAVFYHVWLRKPEEAVVALVVVALMQFINGVREKSADKPIEVRSSDQ